MDKDEAKEREYNAEKEGLDEFLIPTTDRGSEEERADTFISGKDNVFVNTLLKDNTPREIRKQFWAMTSKENALTNMTKDEIQDAMLDMQDMIMSEVMTRGEFEYSFEDRKQMIQLQWAFLRKIRRSKDGFERDAIVKHIQERRIEGLGNAPQKKGFLGRLFRRG